MKVHELKSWPGAFNAVKAGKKRFEVRRDDREFAGGDVIVLREFRPVAEEDEGITRPAGYTGQSIGPFRIGYIGRGGCYPDGFCAFEILRLVVEDAAPVAPVERIADALEVLASTVDRHRNTLAIDDMSNER